MTLWLAALAIGLAVGALGYAPEFLARPALAALAATRALAVALVAAVALGAPVRGTPSSEVIVALDASASWTRANDTVSAQMAVDSAAQLARRAGGRVALVGESLRVALVGESLRVALVGESLRVVPVPHHPWAPSDRATRVAALAESAATAGIPLVFVTDGEVDDADALARAPGGSRLVVVPVTRGRDAAVAELDAPAALAPGDTAGVTVTVTSDAAGAGAGRVTVRLDAGAAIERPIPALGAYGRTRVEVRLPVPADARAHGAVLSASVATPGDREARNDTATRVLDITAAPRAVVVSTAPDYDVGLALSVLRGALAVPVRAYYRVAPGTWRVAGTLQPVRENEVRTAAAAAGVLVLHGDTAVFGSPRTFTRGALALAPAPSSTDSSVDWYAAPGTTGGPFAALASLAWDSLPPLELTSSGPDAAAATARLGERWTGVVARAGRRGPARAVVAGGVDPSGRRVAVVAGGGFWRWAFRGGVGSSAAQGVWGALFDWLADAPARGGETLTLADAMVRSGSPVRWRGADGGDTVRRVRLTRRSDRRVVLVEARRDAATNELRSDSPPPGVYDVSTGGVLGVNASAELLPRRATVRPGAIGTMRDAPSAPAVPVAPGWPLGLATLLLCGEWAARRRAGLR